MTTLVKCEWEMRPSEWRRLRLERQAQDRLQRLEEQVRVAQRALDTEYVLPNDETAREAMIRYVDTVGRLYAPDPFRIERRSNTDRSVILDNSGTIQYFDPVEQTVSVAEPPHGLRFPQEPELPGIESILNTNVTPDDPWGRFPTDPVFGQQPSAVRSGSRRFRF